MSSDRDVMCGLRQAVPYKETSGGNCSVQNYLMFKGELCSHIDCFPIHRGTSAYEKYTKH